MPHLRLPLRRQNLDPRRVELKCMNYRIGKTWCAAMQQSGWIIEPWHSYRYHCSRPKRTMHRSDTEKSSIPVEQKSWKIQIAWLTKKGTQTASSGSSSCFFAISNSFFLMWPSNCVKTMSFCWSNTNNPLFFSIAAPLFLYGMIFLFDFFSLLDQFLLSIYWSFFLIIFTTPSGMHWQLVLYTTHCVVCVCVLCCTPNTFATDKCTWMPFIASVRTNTNAAHKWRRLAGVWSVDRSHCRSFEGW